MLKVTSPEGFAGAFNGARNARAQALIVFASSTFNAHQPVLVDLAAKNRLVTIWEHRPFWFAPIRSSTDEALTCSGGDSL